MDGATAITMTTAISNLTTTMSSVITLVEGNSVMMTFFCAGIFSLAVGMVKKLVGRF